jgi:hypothetical protein
MVVTPFTKPEPVNVTLSISPRVPPAGLKSPACTTRLEVEVFPGGVWLEVMVTLLVIVPVFVPVTFNETRHDPTDGRVAPDKLTEDPPAIPVTVPPQLLVRLLGDATTNPDGKLSVNATPDNEAEELGLLMLKVRLVIPFSGMLATPNVLTICGGASCAGITVKTTPNDVLPAYVPVAS